MSGYRLCTLTLKGERGEKSFPSREQAVAALKNLSADRDCVLAEVEEWNSAPSGILQAITIIAQSERRYRPDLDPTEVGDKWIEYTAPDLRRRTHGGEIREKLEGYADGRP